MKLKEGTLNINGVLLSYRFEDDKLTGLWLDSESSEVVFENDDERRDWILAHFLNEEPPLKRTMGVSSDLSE